MKKFKFLRKVIVMALALALLAPSIIPNTAFSVEAATIKLNKTKATLNIGKTTTLSVTGTTKTVKWSSNKKSVATVTSKGKVTAMAPGTAKITATIDSKKYTCTITVKNPFEAKAGFTATTATLKKINFVVPKDYTAAITDDDSQLFASGQFTPSNFNADAAQVITAVVIETDTPASDYDDIKTMYEQTIRSQLESLSVEIVELKTSAYNAEAGKACVLTYKFKLNNKTYNGKLYVLSIDNYLIQVSSERDSTAKSTPTIESVAKYMIDSIVVLK